MFLQNCFHTCMKQVCNAIYISQVIHEENKSPTNFLTNTTFFHRTIQTCLTVWSMRPKAYEVMRLNGPYLLPSTRHLQRYKNSVEQKPGFNPKLLQWMRAEAERKDVPESGYFGGIVFDEMAIQVWERKFYTM